MIDLCDPVESFKVGSSEQVSIGPQITRIAGNATNGV
jgi:hypothetical protein